MRSHAAPAAPGGCRRRRSAAHSKAAGTCEGRTAPQRRPSTPQRTPQPAPEAPHPQRRRRCRRLRPVRGVSGRRARSPGPRAGSCAMPRSLRRRARRRTRPVSVAPDACGAACCVRRGVAPRVRRARIARRNARRAAPARRRKSRARSGRPGRPAARCASATSARARECVCACAHGTTRLVGGGGGNEGRAGKRRRNSGPGRACWWPRSATTAWRGFRYRRPRQPRRRRGPGTGCGRVVCACGGAAAGPPRHQERAGSRRLAGTCGADTGGITGGISDKRRARAPLPLAGGRMAARCRPTARPVQRLPARPPRRGRNASSALPRIAARRPLASPEAPSTRSRPRCRPRHQAAAAAHPAEHGGQG